VSATHKETQTPETYIDIAKLEESQKTLEKQIHEVKQKAA